jgi:hypothetical protein
MPGEKAVVAMRLVDLRDNLRVASPEHDVFPAPREVISERRTPGTATEHGDPRHAVRPKRCSVPLSSR